MPIGEFFVSLLSNENAVFGADSQPFLATNYDDAAKLWAAQKPIIAPLLERQKLTSGTTFHAAGLVGQLRSNANITQLLGYSVELIGADLALQRLEPGDVVPLTLFWKAVMLSIVRKRRVIMATKMFRRTAMLRRSR